MIEIKFGGYFGLFVYDTKKQEFLRSVDLSSIGCQHTQGDEACVIHVTEDGSIVYLCPMNTNYMYAYLVSENKIVRMPHDLVGIEMYQGLEGELANFEDNGETKAYFLINAYGTIGELGYNLNDGTSNIYPLFRS